MLAHVVERLRPQVAALALNANGDPARFAAFGLPVLADATADFAGPLAGVLAGLDWAAAEGASAIVTAASDTPFFPARPRRGLVAAGGGGLADAATPGPEGARRHPTFGLWPVGLREELRAALAMGARKVGAWAEAQGAASRRFPAGEAFFNVNTPDGSRRAPRAARGRRRVGTCRRPPAPARACTPRLLRRRSSWRRAPTCRSGRSGWPTGGSPPGRSASTPRSASRCGWSPGWRSRRSPTGSTARRRRSPSAPRLSILLFLAHLGIHTRPTLLVATLAVGAAMAGIGPIAEALGVAAARALALPLCPGARHRLDGLPRRQPAGRRADRATGSGIVLWWIVVCLAAVVALALHHPGGRRVQGRVPPSMREIGRVVIEPGLRDLHGGGRLPAGEPCGDLRLRLDPLARPRDRRGRGSARSGRCRWRSRSCS